MAAGFEVEVASAGKEYVRAALVDATQRELVHHHRLPKREYTYRVRSFNGFGASAHSQVVSITTSDHVGTEAVPMPPCKPLPPSQPAPRLDSPQEVVNRHAGQPLYNVPDRSNGLRAFSPGRR